eukprot:GHVU01032715.1.p1 GENE.GHVU01032715.1~~GHVU01032715.1.p1  ORF type:complete len:506 (-),score=49.45 GHVU01032715.1:318-1835(-)
MWGFPVLYQIQASSVSVTPAGTSSAASVKSKRQKGWNKEVCQRDVLESGLVLRETYLLVEPISDELLDDYSGNQVKSTLTGARPFQNRPDIRGVEFPLLGPGEALHLLPGSPQDGDGTEGRLLPSGTENGPGSLKPFHKDRKEKYGFYSRLSKGAYGEVWRALSFALPESHNRVVLKRLFVEKGHLVRMSGLREVHYGCMLKDNPYVARLVEFFEECEHPNPDLWLVFKDEGYSLTHHIWRPSASGLLELTPFWWALKRDLKGEGVLRQIMWQLLLALRDAHDRGVTHRDIKLNNVLLSVSYPIRVRLADWGSAVSRAPDPLYQYGAPSASEETTGYRPFEAEFGVRRHDYYRPPSYDMWGVGVLFLQLVLGELEAFNAYAAPADSPHVGTATPSSAAKESREAAHFLCELERWCIVPPDTCDLPGVSGRRRRRRAATGAYAFIHSVSHSLTGQAGPWYACMHACTCVRPSARRVLDLVFESVRMCVPHRSDVYMHARTHSCLSV